MGNSYTIELEKIREKLTAFELELFTSMLNLMMKGELNNWTINTPINEVIEVDISLLEASEDIHIKKLLLLHKTLSDTIFTLVSEKE